VAHAQIHATFNVDSGGTEPFGGPPPVRVDQADRPHLTLGVLLRGAQRAQIALQSANHDGGQLRLADARPPGEALGIEHLQQRRKAVGMPIVGRGGKEEAVFKMIRQRANAAGGVGVHGVTAGGRRGDDVRFIQHEHRLATSLLLEKRFQRLEVFAATERLVGDDEAGVGGPDGDLETALLTAPRDKVAVEDLEREAKPFLHLVAPLQRDRRRTDDEDAIHTLTKHQLLHDETGFDGFPEAYVVGDEEVDARQLERLFERGKLMIEQVDAGTERGLEEAGIGGRDGVPLEGMEVGGEAARRVQRRRSAQTGLCGADDARPELSFPEDRERTARGIVVEAGEAHKGVLVANARGGDDFVNEVVAVADLGNVPNLGQGVGRHRANVPWCAADPEARRCPARP